MMYRMTAIDTSRNANLFLTAAKSFFGSFAAAFSNLNRQHMIRMHVLAQTYVSDCKRDSLVLGLPVVSKDSLKDFVLVQAATQPHI